MFYVLCVRFYDDNYYYYQQHLLIAGDCKRQSWKHYAVLQRSRFDGV